MNLEELTVAIHHLLDSAAIPHGFGGALALNLYTDPRATRDVDLSAFVSWDLRREVIPSFEALGYTPSVDLDTAIPVAGIRLVSAATDYPIDVFFALDETYKLVQARLVWHPFGPDRELLPFFSAEDIALFKLTFNRDKDWVDLRHIVRDGPPLDIGYIVGPRISMRTFSM